MINLFARWNHPKSRHLLPALRAFCPAGASPESTSLVFSGMTSRVARACTVLLVLALGATAAEWALTFSARRTLREPVSALVLGNQVARSQAAETVSIARLFGALP